MEHEVAEQTVADLQRTLAAQDAKLAQLRVELAAAKAVVPSTAFPLRPYIQCNGRRLNLCAFQELPLSQGYANGWNCDICRAHMGTTAQLYHDGPTLFFERR